VEKTCFVGVDVGGTKVAAGLVNAEGEIAAQIRVPMISNGTPESGLNAVLLAIAQIAPAGDVGISGIGICAPGPLDPETGIILNPPNVPCWRGFPLADAVRDIHRVPVKVDNDANAAALAESRWGAGRGYRNLFYATIGTGIGTGIILDGKVYHGRTGSAGEGGHVSIDYRGPICRCGKPGGIEILASGTAIARRAQEVIEAGRKSSIIELAGVGAISGEIVGKASENGDPLAREILFATTEMLALWLSNMVDLFDPEIIVIGGGAAAMLRLFFDQLRKRMPKFAVNPRASEVPIVQARYGADAGIAGGAAPCA